MERLRAVAPRFAERAGSIALRGRTHECAALDRLLDPLRRGESGVLVLRGEAGVGKSALLDYVSTRATGVRVARASGVESEMEFAYAGLHQLCAPFLDRLDLLPRPQRDAVEAAFGMSSGNPPDRLFLGLAVLGLFSQIGAEQPLLCVVDDSQWLDQSSIEVLAFVARRLRADPVALLFATRSSTAGDVLTGLPELRLEGLRGREARELLREVVRGPLDERVADRIVVETDGNPLALLELPRGLASEDLAAGFGSAGALPVSHPVQSSFLQRVRALPAETQTLLVIAAAEPTGDPATLWRAGQRLGIGATRQQWPRPTASSRSEPTSRFVTRCSGLPSMAMHPKSFAAPRTARSQRSQIRTSIRIAESGIARTRRSVPTRPSPRSSSIQRSGRKRAAASPPPQRSSSEPRP